MIPGSPHGDQRSDFKLEIFTDSKTNAVFWILLRKLVFEEGKETWRFVEAGRADDFDAASRKFTAAYNAHKNKRDSTQGMRRVREDE